MTDRDRHEDAPRGAGRRARRPRERHGRRVRRPVSGSDHSLRVGRGLVAARPRPPHAQRDHARGAGSLRAENELGMHVRAALGNGLTRGRDPRGDPPHRCLRRRPGGQRCVRDREGGTGRRGRDVRHPNASTSSARRITCASWVAQITVWRSCDGGHGEQLRDRGRVPPRRAARWARRRSAVRGRSRGPGRARPAGSRRRTNARLAAWHGQTAPPTRARRQRGGSRRRCSSRASCSASTTFSSALRKSDGRRLLRQVADSARARIEARRSASSRCSSETVDQYLACVGHVDPGEHPQQRRLARARSPGDAVSRPAANGRSRLSITRRRPAPRPRSRTTERNCDAGRAPTRRS